ncbi:hypothetical protein Trisim1_008501 [Trichoderma cf. simile WF8]
MKNPKVAIPRPREASDTSSTKARRGSPQPMPDAGDNRSTRSHKILKDKPAVKTQNDLLYGVGSQFPTIDGSIKNKGIHPKL